MPKTVPKPKLRPNGRWKLRITVPSDLREMGFADGKREIIRTHPPCTSRVARSWAYREFLLFEAQVASFKLQQSGDITPEQPEVNTSGPMGKLLLGVLGAVAEFETGLRRERQMEGIAKAKAAGTYRGGQPIKREKVEKLRALVGEGVSISAAAREAGISRVTAYKYLI